MFGDLWLEAILIIVLILANGVFAASELAIVSARRGRLEQKAQEGQRGAAIALELAESPDRFLSTVQVGITLIGTLAAAFGGDRFAGPLAALIRDIFPGAARYAAGIALAVVVVVISYLSLILGELVPKRLAIQSAERVASAVAPLMQGLSRLASPIVSFLTFSQHVILRLLGRHNVEEEPVTEDDVMALVREGTEEGTVELSERELISSVFSFTDRTVRSLMTPRMQVAAVDIEAPLDEVLQIVTESGFSRLPVYRQTLDRIEGVLNAKDLLLAWRRPEPVDLPALLRPGLFIPESQRAVIAFQRLKQSRRAFAIVLDEYGQVAGVVTMEDMLEALVGEIDDEYDDAEETIVVREDGSYLVDGLLSFKEARERLQLPNLDKLANEREFETFAGFVLLLLGRMPQVGDVVQWGGYAIEVVDMDGRRIDKLLVRAAPPAPPA